VKFTLPIKTINELNDHSFWRTRQRRAKSQRAMTVACLAASGVRGEHLAPLFPCRLKFTRIAPGNGLDRGDGLPSAFKFIRDAITELIGPDDRDRGYEWEYDQRRGSKGEYAVEVEISPVTVIGGSNPKRATARRGRRG
jgi:hypothetical protein